MIVLVGILIGVVVVVAIVFTCMAIGFINQMFNGADHITDTFFKNIFHIDLKDKANKD
jgi:hypothetical protein